MGIELVPGRRRRMQLARIYSSFRDDRHKLLLEV